MIASLKAVTQLVQKYEGEKNSTMTSCRNNLVA